MTTARIYIWERQESDTDKSYQAFCVYRDMGRDRTLEQAWIRYKEGTKKVQDLPTYFKVWSSKHNWVARASAYDDYLDEQTRSAFEKRLIDERAKMIEDELNDYHSMLGVWREKFKIVQDIKGVGVSYYDLDTLAKWRDTIAKQGRRALELPDRYTQQKVETTTPRDATWEQALRNIAEGGDDGW